MVEGLGVVVVSEVLVLAWWGSLGAALRCAYIPLPPRRTIGIEEDAILDAVW